MSVEAALEAAELARAAGLDLDPWQVDVLKAGLGERADGKWAAFEVGLIVPRQNGKGAILEAVELAGLFLFGERLILHSAHEFKTAAEAFRRVWTLIEQTPDLDRLVFRKLQNNNDMSIELKSGQRLRFVARSTGSGRGFSGDRVILDEAYKLPVRAVSALLPTLSARPNPQLWYTSSAPLPIEDSDYLRTLCRRGREAKGGRLAYVEYSVDLNADLDDRANWYASNPALGVERPDGSGITEDWVAETERAAMPDDEFARERLGVVDLTPNGGWQVVTLEDWQQCQDDKSGPVGDICFAIEVAEDRGWSAIGVSGPSGRGGSHVELTYDQAEECYDYRPGTDWVVARAKALHAKWQRPFAVVKGSPAWSLETELRTAGVELIEVSAAEFAQACAQLYDAATQHTLKHLGQPALTTAVGALAKKPVGGDAFVWDRRRSGLDISPATAVTVARWAASTYQGPIASGLIDPNEDGDDW